MKKRMYYLAEDGTFRIKLGTGFNVLFDRQPEPRRMYKVMFFTGLFDSGRRKIYEGDLLGKTGEELWEVFFDGGRFQVRNDSGDEQDLHRFNPGRSGFEVVDNIYNAEQKAA